MEFMTSARSGCAAPVAVLPPVLADTAARSCDCARWEAVLPPGLAAEAGRRSARWEAVPPQDLGAEAGRRRTAAVRSAEPDIDGY